MMLFFSFGNGTFYFMAAVPCNFDDAVFPFGNGTFTFSGSSFRCHFHDAIFFPLYILFLVATVFLAVLRMLFFSLWEWNIYFFWQQFSLPFSWCYFLPFVHLFLVATVFLAVLRMLLFTFGNGTFTVSGSSFRCHFHDAIFFPLYIYFLWQQYSLQF